MIDLQNSSPILPLPINKVGVKGVKHPIVFAINEHKKQATTATFNMYINLAEDKRGTHMSRFLEVLNEQKWELSIPGLQELLMVTKNKLQADNVFVESNFIIFLDKEAPVSKAQGLVDYPIKLKGSIIKNKVSLKFAIKIPVTTLCPCSKEISAYGAHNQRSYITVTITTNNNINFHEVITMVEKKSSSEIYSILKRSDEKFVTEQAYDNPKFVEDIVRDIANNFNNDARIINYKIESENIESIHNHSAYAVIYKY